MKDFDKKLRFGSSLSVPRPEIQTHPPKQQKETPPPPTRDVFVDDEKPEPESRYKPPPPPFFQVLSIDTAKSSSFLPCTGTIAAGFAAPMVRPLVFTLHGKIYVLALVRYRDQPCFQVFDDGK